MDARTLTLLSVVAPVFNEAETLEAFYGRVVDALAGVPFELVLVDDGSSDRTSSASRWVGRHSSSIPDRRRRRRPTGLHGGRP